MLKDLKIGTRLALGYSVMIMLMVEISGIAMTSFKRIDDKVAGITEDRWPKTVILNQMNDRINVVARALRNALLVDNQVDVKKELDRVAQARAEISNFMDQLELTVASAEGKELLKVIKESRAAYLTVLQEAIGLIESGGRDEAVRMLISKLRPLQSSYFAAVGKMIESQGNQVNRARKDEEATYKAADRHQQRDQQQHSPDELGGPADRSECPGHLRCGQQSVTARGGAEGRDGRVQALKPLTLNRCHIAAPFQKGTCVELPEVMGGKHEPRLEAR